MLLGNSHDVNSIMEDCRNPFGDDCHDIQFTICIYNYTIYCYQLTQTNQNPAFYFAGGVFSVPRWPRQVEVEDWNKVRQGGHPSIDLAHVAPEAATKTRHMDVSKK